jgi:hypothetical protein
MFRYLFVSILFNIFSTMIPSISASFSTTVAPKKKTVAKSEIRVAELDESQDEKQPLQPTGGATVLSRGCKKRKQTACFNDSQKQARRSRRGTSKSQPSQEQLLNFLLSQAAEDLCLPDEEVQDIKSRGSIRTYSSVMNPFEELRYAVILSRLISHRLGLRSIRTILNDPYNFTSAEAVKNAGSKQHYQALLDAKTQPKGKTAEQIGQIASVVLEMFTASGD